MKTKFLVATLSALAATTAACAQQSAEQTAPGTHHQTRAKVLYQGFRSPTAITSDKEAVYLSDWSANMVYRIGSDGKRTVFAKDIAAPAGLALDKNGTLFIASYSDDYIVCVERNGSVRRVISNLATPTGIAFAADGRLLIANRAAGEIIAVNLGDGARQVRATGLSLPVGVVEMADGSLVVSQYGGRVTQILPDGGTRELGEGFNRPGVGIAADGDNGVLVADNGAGVIRRIDLKSGQSQAISPKLDGSVVALGKGINGEWLIGAWGSGKVYKITR